MSEIMYAWLIYDRAGAVRNEDYIRYHHELGQSLGIRFDVMIREENTDAVFLEKARAHRPDAALVRTIEPSVNRLLESDGIPVYNSYHVSGIANHKGRCIEYIRTHTDVPCIPLKETAEPGDVIKPVAGHGGIGVVRAESGGSVPAGCICQPFIEGPCEDVRVYVIGKRIVAAVKRKAQEGEFRANASLGGSVSPYELSASERDYVEQIICQFDFGMVGIDFVIDQDGQFVFSEIEDVVGARMLYRTFPDLDILKEYFIFLLSAFYEKNRKTT